MLQNGYDIVSVLADKRLTPDGSVPYDTKKKSFFGKKPTWLTPEEEAEETARAKYAVDSITNGRLLWVVEPKVRRDAIVKCINTLATATPKVGSTLKGPAADDTELTVYLVGHGVKNASKHFALAFDDIRLVSQDAVVRVFHGYTMFQLLEDLKLDTRWKHLLVIADACTAGAALTKDCYVAHKAETFLDDAWTLAYHTPSYQLIGSSLNATEALSLPPWRGTVFSMAMDLVLWRTSPTAFDSGSVAAPYNWATVGHVVVKLREGMNSVMKSLLPTADYCAPPCLHGRLDLAHYLVDRPNIGQFLFVRHGAPALWPRGVVTTRVRRFFFSFLCSVAILIFLHVVCWAIAVFCLGRQHSVNKRNTISRDGKCCRFYFTRTLDHTPPIHFYHQPQPGAPHPHCRAATRHTASERPRRSSLWPRRTSRTVP